MGLLKRLSDNLWSYVSPRKDTAKPVDTPQTAPLPRKRGRPPGPRHKSIEHVIRHEKSMSPVTRVDSWRAESVSVASDVSRKRKRKAPTTPSSGVGRRAKVAKPRVKIEYEDDVNGDLEDEYGEPEEDYDEDDESDLRNGDQGSYSDNIDVHRSLSPAADRSTPFDEDEADGDTSLVVSEQFESPGRKKIISPTKEFFGRGISAEDLRAQGWDDDHIVLVQKIAMRGYEPVLPIDYQLPFPFIPDALFTENDDEAFISSCRGEHVRAEKALGRLFELGGRIRDTLVLRTRTTPEQQTKRMIKEYLKWTLKDSNLDHRTAIPMVVVEAKPTSVSGSQLQANATHKLEKVANRYREAFRVKQSIESTPSSHASNLLAYPLPTLYAFICSGTAIALMAYRPEDLEPEATNVAILKMQDKAYDIWNALAMAMVMCHCRNVQMRVAEETGLGAKGPGWVESEVEDLDL